MIPSWYETIFAQYSELLNKYDRLYIGLSAGIDSNMLLNWLHTYKDQLPPVTAIHVNHQWHGEDSFIWADFAKNSAERYGFDFINYDVLIDIDEKGAEACGREARYIKFAETMVKNSVLVVAHHRSDQAETVMYRLLRGSGTLGLGGMRDVTQLKFGDHELSVCRPFLSISKASLYEAGRMMNIPWMEDYTNHSTEEARNQIRNAIFPKIAEYFPHYEQTFARSAQLIQESDLLLAEIAEQDYENNTQQCDDKTLNLQHLKTLTPLRQKNLLRYWLKQFDVMLEKRQFDEFLSMFIDKKPTSKSCFFMADWEIRAHEDRLYFLKTDDLKKPNSNYQLVMAENAPVMEFWESFNLELMTREDGMNFHPIWRDKSQTVKKLLQEIKLKPWLRKDIKVLKDKNTQNIVWIEHLGLNHAYKDKCHPQGFLPQLIERE